MDVGVKLSDSFQYVGDVDDVDFLLGEGGDGAVGCDVVDADDDVAWLQLLAVDLEDGLVENQDTALLLEGFREAGVAIVVSHLEVALVIERDTFLDGNLNGIEQQVFIVEDAIEGVLLLGGQTGGIVGGEALLIDKGIETSLARELTAQEENLLLGISVEGLDSLLLFLPGDVVGIAEGVAHLDDLAVGVLQVGIVDEEYLEMACLGVADAEAKQQ